MVLAVLDAAIANVALPSLAQSLQVTPGMSVWIITAYQAALVMGLLPCAALGESLGCWQPPCLPRRPSAWQR